MNGRKTQLLASAVIVVLALVAANVAWLFPTLDELEAGVYTLHRAAALDIRNQLISFFNQHEQALTNAADILNRSQVKPADAISRLIKENQPFESVSVLDLNGRERFKQHRFFLITPADFRDRSVEPLFGAVKKDKVFRSAVFISDTSEPVVTMAIPLKKASGLSALVAEVNLKSLLDVARNIVVGEGRVIYVVDREGYIIAHPNSSLVFGRTNVLERRLVRQALDGTEADTRTRQFSYENEMKEKVFAVALPFELMGWAIVVENPASSALATSRGILSAALASFVVEIFLLALLIWNYSKSVASAALFYTERNQREAILNSLYDGVLEYDENFKVTLINPKAEELLGIKFKDVKGLAILPDSAKGKPALKGLVELMYPALAPYASHTKELAGVSSAKLMEVHLSQGTRLLVTLTHVVDERGKVRGFLKILRDVSREDLLRRVKSEFVSVAAHQLRTPLSAIKWTLKLLIDGDAGALTAPQQEFLERGYVINERMIKLVNDLLNAARIEEGRFGYEFKDVSLIEFLKNVTDTYVSLAGAKGVEFELKKSADIPSLIYADSEKLSLALGNLMDNAIKYTPAGGKVVLKVLRKGDFIEVSVSDTGVGIPEEDQKRVFSKFFRASNVLRMETEGTGLGLFIVRNIIRRHGGDVSFSSRLGDGTTFSFILPVIKDLVPKVEAPALEEFLEAA